MEVIYQIKYEERVVKRDITGLPKTIRERIKKAIESRLTSHPLEYGKPLKHSYHGVRRIRVGDHRILYTINNANKTVTIVAIDHRKYVYEA